MPDTKVKCSERVLGRGRWPDSYQCSRPSTVERDGKPYCTQHDPERIKAQAEARNKVCHYKARPYLRECGEPALAERGPRDWEPRCSRHTEAALAADKRLRGAAPALLAALDKTMTYLDAHPPLSYASQDTFDQYRAALTGGEAALREARGKDA